MMAAEERSYILSGELPAKKWEMVMQLLGNLGVESARTDGLADSTAPLAAREIITELEGTLVDKRDMAAFAVSHDYNQLIATRAWNHLVRIYDNPRMSGPIPLRYRVTPADGICTSQVTFRGLQVESVAELLAEIDRRTAEFDDEHKAIIWVIGKSAGRNMVKFLRHFVADSLSGDNADSTIT
jgi:hypothetical protein